MPPAATPNDYYCPAIKKIAVALKADDESFVPVYQPDGSAIVKSNSNAKLPNFGEIDVDCGMELEIPPGYRLIADIVKTGVFLLAFPKIEKRRLIVTLVNVGKDIVEIKKGDPFVKISVSPIYSIKWQ
jgi:dUTPase